MKSLDFWLAVGVLAVIPLWMAAYGGHVAAESISHSRLRRNVKLRFWSIGFLGLIVAFAYQYRVMKTDEARQQTAQEWEASVTRQLDVILKNPTLSIEQKQVADKLKTDVAKGPRALPLKQRALLLANRIQTRGEERESEYREQSEKFNGVARTTEINQEIGALSTEFAKANKTLFKKEFGGEVTEVTKEFRSRGLFTFWLEQAVDSDDAQFNWDIFSSVAAHLRSLVDKIDDSGKIGG